MPPSSPQPAPATAADEVSPPPLSVGAPHALFRIGASRFALPIGEVQEVVGSLEITPVPRAGLGWLGIGNLRGEIVPAATLTPWFPERPAAIAPSKSKSVAGSAGGPIFLILQTKAGKLALAADGFDHVVAIPPDATEPLAANSLEPDFVPSRWQPPGEPQAVCCLDAARLTERLRLVAAGADPVIPA